MRKEIEAYIIKYVDKIAPGGYNKQLYVDLFKNMSNKQFDAFMVKLKNKELTISVIVPTGGNVKLDIKRNLNIGKELGFNFFQKLTIGPKGTVRDGTYIPKYTTPIEYLIFDLPFRRTAQLLTKGLSTTTDNKAIDLTTGQVTGDSRSARITKPELELLVGMGMKETINELMVTRGGDLGSAKAMDASISRTGSVSHHAIEPYSTGVESTKTVTAFFNAAMISMKGLKQF